KQKASCPSCGLNWVLHSFYWFTGGIMLLAVVGLLGRLRQWRHTHQPVQLAVHAGWLLIMYISLIRWIRQLRATEQGRLLYPAIASIAILLIWGMSTLPYRQWLKRISVGGLAVWTAVLPFITILPAFAHPDPLPASTPIPDPQAIVFGDSIRLRGYALSQPAVQVGESLTLDLYWQAERPINDSYTVAVHLLDAAGQVVAQLDTIPYNGRFSTTVWPVGRMFKDSYTLPPLAETAVPGQGTILVKLYPWRQTAKKLPVTVHDTPVGDTVHLTQFKIDPPPVTYQPAYETAVTFATVAELFGFDAPISATAGQSIPLTLYWQAVQPDGNNYTVFVHLLDAEGALVTQADGMPQNGRFPTSIWASGEQIADQHLLQLPEELAPGVYQIVTGLYDGQNGRRLPAYQTDGNSLPNDAVNLHKITINPAP
ncbi:MAG: hypothetical protein ACE5EY_18400, partial [Anaerolineae bacterium]